MDEELIELTTEEVVEVGATKVIENEVRAEDLEQNIGIEERITTVEVETIEDVNIEINEAVGWVGGDNSNHHSLYGRDEPDQHPITSITGLRDELNDIEALDVVYSNRKGQADYYEWEDGNALAETRVGYFVSLCQDIRKIKICDDDNIFGVIIDDAAFVGGQDDIKRDYKYGLVAYSGVAHVKCELNVEVGDYVVSNNYGMAKKSNTDYGCQVVALHDIKNVKYATILFDTSLKQLNLLGEEIDVLDSRMDDAEQNIASATYEANKANQRIDNLQNNISDFQNDIKTQTQESINTSNSAIQTIEAYKQQIADAQRISAEAQVIANLAVTSAEDIRKEAVKTANSALDEANKTQDEMNGLITKMDPLVEWTSKDGTQSGIGGFVAQAEADRIKLAALSEWKEGDTQSLAGIITTVGKHEAILTGFAGSDGELKETIAQVEQKADDNGTSITNLVSSVDKYSVGEYSQAYGLTREQAASILKPGYIYIPTAHSNKASHSEKFIGESKTNKFTPGDYYVWGINDQGKADWIEHNIGKVWINQTKPANSTGGLKYWYINSNTAPSGYESYALYIWETPEGKSPYWKKVNVLSGNVNNRATSMIRQKVDEVALEVTNARGSATSLNARLNDSESAIKTVASWKTNVENNVAKIATIEQKANANGASIAQVVKNGQIDAASIVLAINNAGSAVTITADHININGKFTTNGNAGFTTEGNLFARGGQIGGWQITSDSLIARKDGTDLNNFVILKCPSQWAGGDLSQGKGDVLIVRSKGSYPFALLSDGSLICTKANIAGRIVADDGKIAGWDITEHTMQKTVQKSGINYTTGLQTPDSGTWAIAVGATNSQEWKTAPFRVDHYGNMHATSGTIGGWTIDANSINNTTQTGYQVHLWNPAIAGGDIITFVKNGEHPFRVTRNGILHAIGATITGNITATSGKIGGWDISTQSLSSGAANTGGRFVLAAPNKIGANDWVMAVHVNDGNKTVYPFTLTKNGVLTATKANITGKIVANDGTIGGWNITKSYFYGGDASNGGCMTFYAPDQVSSSAGWIMAVHVKNGNNSTYPLYLTKGGKLTANDAVIRGNITATTGKIGGWTINGGKMYAGDGVSVKTSVVQAASSSVTWVFAAGGSSHDSYSDCPFRVDKNGKLYATKGTIGGWDITAERMMKETDFFTVFLHAPTSISESGGAGDVLVVYDKTNNKYPFILKSSGKLTATNATIIGNITATSGKIAGWNISGEKLYYPRTSSTNNGVGMATTGDGASPVFWAGYTGTKSDNPYGSAGQWLTTTKFYVTANGKLFADNAEIKGALKAGTILQAGVKLIDSSSVQINVANSVVKIQHVNPTVTTSGLEIARGWTALVCSSAGAYVYNNNRGALVGTWTDNSGVGVTSDKNCKNSIASIDDRYEAFFNDVKPRIYKYNDGTSNRIHTGFIAQEVEEAILNNGLTTQDLAITMLMDDLNVETNLSHKQYYLRYNEFVALNTWQIQKAKARITELENEVATVKEQVAMLIKGE